MNRDRAMRFVRRHGVVLESARGPEPSLAALVVGGPIAGSWWAHPAGHEIYALTQQIRNSRAVLVCGLANGRITYVHRRLWPGFVLLARHFPAGALDRIHEVHLPSGRHRREDVAFPAWVPKDVLQRSEGIDRDAAAAAIRPWLERYGKP